MDEIAIEMKDLSKRFQERIVLDQISFSVPQGQKIALVGPSGGGKSTLLRCMTGLEVFEEGMLQVAGIKVHAGHNKNNVLAHKELHLKTGLVFQQWHLFPHQTALENVIEAPIHVKKISTIEAKSQAEELLKKVGLAHRMNALPRHMSGGEQQRCAIARALAMNPKVLFMDEPTSALDPQRVGDLVELLEQLVQEQQLTLVVVTHEMSFARKLVNRILVLYEGQVIEDGPPEEVLLSPKDSRTREFLGLDEIL